MALDTHNCPDCNGSGWNRIQDNDCLTCNGSGIAQTADGLLELIRIASDPANKPPVYRPARFNAYRLTRQLVRNAVAAEWREKLQQSADLAAMTPRIMRVIERDGCLYDLDNTRWSTE